MDIGSLLAVVIGFFLKSHPGINNKIIPVLLFISQFVGRLLLELGVGVAHAGGFGAAFHSLGLGAILLKSAISTLVAVGVHSSGKNVLQSFKNNVAEQLAAKL